MRARADLSLAVLFGMMTMLATFSRAAHAQHPNTARLEARLPTTVRGPVVALADSAERAGLPRAPLIDKALEGVSKGANAQRILAAVRVVATNLGAARQALGDKAPADEVTAGAAALRSGVASNELVHMRKALPGRTLTVPLSVLSALVVQGISVSDASQVVVAQAKHDNDERLLAVGQDAVRRLAAGVPPQTVVQAFGASLTDPTLFPLGSSTEGKALLLSGGHSKAPKVKP
jgi:hypothetical protein